MPATSLWGAAVHPGSGKVVNFHACFNTSHCPKTQPLEARQATVVDVRPCSALAIALTKLSGGCTGAVCQDVCSRRAIFNMHWHQRQSVFAGRRFHTEAPALVLYLTDSTPGKLEVPLCQLSPKMKIVA